VCQISHKLQSIAEKAAKKIIGGYFFVPHPVDKCEQSDDITTVTTDGSYVACFRHC